MLNIRTLLLLVLVFLLLIPASGFLLFRLSSSADADLHDLDLQNGDLILRRGRSLESFAVFLADKNRDYSHIGIVVVENGNPFVIHAVPGESATEPETVIKERPADFLSRDKASRFAVYRSVFQAGEREKVALKALEYYQNNTGFDHEYNLDSDQKVYCTELVLKAYEQASLDTRWLELKEIRLFSGSRKILFPGTFINSPQFFSIYNPDTP
jgi:hypothetical protein